MEQRRRNRTRVLGPYRHPKGWHVVVIAEEGGRSDRLCTTEEEAHQFIRDIEHSLELEGPITVKQALEKYEQWQSTTGKRPGSIRTTIERLRSLHRSSDLGPRRLAQVTPADCAAAYAALVARRFGKTQRQTSVDTHRNALGEAKTFGRWCIGQGWIRRSPWERVEPMGARKRGKPQLRVDEARRWLAVALERAETDPAAVAAMCTLILGFRASEVALRVGRDVDDNGRLLWIDRTKTKAGERVVEVPDFLQPHLIRLAKAAGAEGRLWDHDRHWVREQVKRICRLAQVPVLHAQSMRGGHSSLAIRAGASPHLVAASLGHASPAVTLSNYAEAGAVAAGRQERLLRVVAGGRR